VAWQWVLLGVAVVVFVAAGYRRSLSRNDTRACHHCGGGGKHRAWVWRYAAGPCKARTWLPPRAACDGGRVPRYGRRVLGLDKER
jgi:hypothetical protein